MNLLQSALRELSARRRIDVLDAQWEQEMAKHIFQRRRNSRLYVSPGNDWAAGMVGGSCIVIYSVCMLVQFLASPKGGLLPTVFFVFLLAAGLFVIGASFRARKKLSLYQRERAQYTAARKLLVEQLPAEFQRPLRFCPNCVNQDPE